MFTAMARQNSIKVFGLKHTDHRCEGHHISGVSFSLLIKKLAYYTTRSNETPEYAIKF